MAIVAQTSKLIILTYNTEAAIETYGHELLLSLSLMHTHIQTHTLSLSLIHKQPLKILGAYTIGYRNTRTGNSKRLDVIVMENLLYGRKSSKVCVVCCVRVYMYVCVLVSACMFVCYLCCGIVSCQLYNCDCLEHSLALSTCRAHVVSF